MNQLQIFFQSLAKQKNEVFLIDALSGRSFTFHEFLRIATNLSKIFRQKNIHRGERLALFLNNSPEYAMMLFACLHAGIVAVPINPQLHPNEIRHIFNRTGAKLIVSSPQTQGLLDPFLGQGSAKQNFVILPTREYDGYLEKTGLWTIDSVGPSVEATFEDFSKGLDPEALMTITFTSGTTGTPKDIAHRAGSLFSSARSFNNALGFDFHSRFYHIFSMSYMAGILNTILCPFLAGASVVIDRPFDALLAIKFWEAPVRYQANTLWLVPTILSALLRLDRSSQGVEYCQNHIKAVCVGTAPLPLKIKEAFEDRYKVKVFESYGLSETLFVATNSPQCPYVPNSAGQLLPEVSVKVVDDKGFEIPPGGEGEILIQTPFLMNAAEKNEGDRAQVTSECFLSGDIGRITDDRHIFITGRKKDLIIRGGINISPVSIEHVLMEHESVENVAVLGLPHEFYGEEVVAILKLKNNLLLERVRPALEELCLGRLNHFSQPTKYIQVSDFPCSAVGKIQKSLLRIQLLSAE